MKVTYVKFMKLRILDQANPATANKAATEARQVEMKVPKQ